MGILLVGLPDTLAVTTIRRLVAQGDEVRILLERGAVSAPWQDLGAHVAFGAADDEDLAWRAATGVRTVVIGELPGGGGAIEPFLRGVERAGTERVVVCSPEPAAHLVEELGGTKLEYIILTTARKPLLRQAKSRIPLTKIAEAIDASDDLSGRLRLDLNLTVEESWRILRVLPPDA